MERQLVGDRGIAGICRPRVSKVSPMLQAVKYTQSRVGNGPRVPRVKVTVEVKDDTGSRWQHFDDRWGQISSF